MCIKDNTCGFFSNFLTQKDNFRFSSTESHIVTLRCDSDGYQLKLFTLQIAL